MKNTLVQLKWLRETALTLVASALLLATVPAGAANGLTEVVHIDFDSDTPGQPPLTGGPNQPTFLVSESGKNDDLESPV